MSGLSRLLPAFNRLSVQPATIAIVRSYVTPTIALKAPAKATTKSTKSATKAPTKKSKDAPAKKTASKTKTASKKSASKKKSASEETEDSPPKKGLKAKITSSDLKINPMKPRTPWIFYVKANKEKFVPEEGEEKCNAVDVMAELAKDWKALSEEEKKPYVEQAIVDKERFKKESEDLFSSATPEDFRKENAMRRVLGKRTIKDPNAPKHPKSSYIFFAMEKWEKGSMNGMTEQMKLAGSVWKSLSEAEKKPYIEKANADRERYIKEMALYDPEYTTKRLAKLSK